MQKFNKKFKMQRLNRFAKIKRFKARVQKKRTKIRRFASGRGLLRAAFRCIRKASFKTVNKRTLKSVPFKNILINARTAINFKKVLKGVAKPVNKLTRSPQSIMFGTFFRSYSTLVKTKGVVKHVQSDVSSQLYESLRECLRLAKPILEAPANAKVQDIVKDLLSMANANGRGGNSRQDKQDFHNKAGKFKAAAANWVPAEQWKKMSKQDKQDFHNKAGKFKAAAVATRSAIKKSTRGQTADSPNWIPEDKWKKMPRKTRNTFLASIGKLKPKRG